MKEQTECIYISEPCLPASTARVFLADVISVSAGLAVPVRRAPDCGRPCFGRTAWRRGRSVTEPASQRQLFGTIVDCCTLNYSCKTAWPDKKFLGW